MKESYVDFAMIDFETALKEILDHAHPLPTTSVALSGSLGYVLAEEIRAREPVPLFDSSAVDGFAVRLEDVENASDENPIRLRVQGVIRAGDSAPVSSHRKRLIRLPLEKNCTIKILTGALIPEGADTVIMREFVEEHGDEIIVRRAVRQGENIRRQGEEFEKGNVVFSSDTLITPPVIGMLATLGYMRVRVHRKPRVALIMTGNELRSPLSRLRAGQIRDSNSFALLAAMRSIGIEPLSMVRTKDDKKVMKAAFSAALKRADVVISVGGVSVGDYDFVKEALVDLDVETVFWKVAMKPGKPNFFGVRGKKLIFGLPGNPVSALISFQLLVKPALQTMMGIVWHAPLSFKAVLGEQLKKKPGRLEFVRGVLSLNSEGELIVMPAIGQDSHMMGGLAKANCLVHFSKEKEYVSEGVPVIVTLLNWSNYEYSSR